MKKVFEVKEKDKLRAFQSPVRGDEIMKICNFKIIPAQTETVNSTKADKMIKTRRPLTAKFRLSR